MVSHRSTIRRSERLTCRPMKEGEETIVRDLILRVFHKHVAPTYSQEGIETFLRMLTPDFLGEWSLEKFSIVAEQHNRIIGIISTIGISHIALLFVESEFQGRGVGKALIQSCMHMCLEAHPNLRAITLSSTPNSVSYYETVGFVTIDEEKNEHGMRFVPMRKTIET